MAKSSKTVFSFKDILKNFESLRQPNGAFVAAPLHEKSSYCANENDYWAVWRRDRLYSTHAYWYLGEHEKLKQGVHLIFDFYKKYKKKLKLCSTSPREITDKIPHAKVDPNLSEITENWGHLQLDADGLFMHIAADLNFKHVDIFRDEEDYEILQLLVFYLRSLEYWCHPDFGMWEECKIRHSSSIGAVYGGLSYLKRRNLGLEIPDTLIDPGKQALKEILPYESRDICSYPWHQHDCDAAQLSLIWPYNVISDPQEERTLVSRILEGHQTPDGKFHRLLQKHGINRY